MSYFSDNINKILDAPVSKVVDTVEKTLGVAIQLKINQNYLHNDVLIRNIVMQVGGMPIIFAQTKASCNVLPKKLLGDLLNTEMGIGAILQKNNFKLKRKTISLEYDKKGTRLVRKYIIHERDIVWFKISETFLLTNMFPNNNSRGSPS